MQAGGTVVDIRGGGYPGGTAGRHIPLGGGSCGVQAHAR